MDERYDLSKELEENGDGSGYYPYLKGIGDSFFNLGQLTLTSVAPIMPIDFHAKIEDIPVDNGMLPVCLT